MIHFPNAFIQETTVHADTTLSVYGKSVKASKADQVLELQGLASHQTISQHSTLGTRKLLPRSCFLIPFSNKQCSLDRTKAENAPR